MQTSRFAVFALLLSVCGRAVMGLPGGAPTAACGDITQQHFVDPMDCASECPFSVSLVAVDGEPVSAGEQTYKCGSKHTREN